MMSAERLRLELGLVEMFHPSLIGSQHGKKSGKMNSTKWLKVNVHDHTFANSL